MVHRRGAISCGAQIAYAVCLGHRPAPVEWIEEHRTGTMDSHSWDFGDGGTSTEENPTHTYNTAGIYTVTLTVSGPLGSNTLIRTDLIDVDPPAHTLRVDDQTALTVLLKAGDWLSGGDWENAAQDELGANRTRNARGRLLRARRVVRVEVRTGRHSRQLFAPSERIGPVAWPDPPATPEEYEERGK